MKIYTRFGDRGQTRLFGGEVVDKDNLRVEVYGSFDELNSWLGLAAHKTGSTEIRQLVTKIQSDLLTISAHLATPDPEKQKQLKTAVSGKDVAWLEETIDSLENQLQPLQNFILPGGNGDAAILHLARTVCRRGERQLFRLKREVPVDEEIGIYINRLSDLLFVLARFANKSADIDDITWTPESKE